MLSFLLQDPPVGGEISKIIFEDKPVTLWRDVVFRASVSLSLSLSLLSLSLSLSRSISLYLSSSLYLSPLSLSIGGVGCFQPLHQRQHVRLYLRGPVTMVCTPSEPWSSKSPPWHRTTQKDIIRENETTYLHRSGPLLENDLDRPENRYDRYGFASFYSISISTVGLHGARVSL